VRTAGESQARVPQDILGHVEELTSPSEDYEAVDDAGKPLNRRGQNGSRPTNHDANPRDPLVDRMRAYHPAEDEGGQLGDDGGDAFDPVRRSVAEQADCATEQESQDHPGRGDHPDEPGAGGVDPPQTYGDPARHHRADQKADAQEPCFGDVLRNQDEV